MYLGKTLFAQAMDLDQAPEPGKNFSRLGRAMRSISMPNRPLS